MMRNSVMVLLVVLGLASCAVDVPAHDDVASQESAVESPAPPDGTDVIRDDDPRLPGSCNNPVSCGETPNQNPHGDNPDQCSGCDCAPSPASCRSCQSHCYRDLLNCLGSTGMSEAGCDAAFGRTCEDNCGGKGLTCNCPSH